VFVCVCVQATVGGGVPLLMALYLFSSGLALTALRRPIAQYTVRLSPYSTR
jgi:hypothetical protein